MKKIILPVLLVFGFTLTVSAQEYNYSIGLTGQAFFYKNYNIDDWNNRPQSYPDNPNTINGYAIGIVFKKNLNKYFSIKSELAYSYQYQKHVSTTWNLENLYYNVNIHSQFKILKFPIIPTFEYELGYESGYFISAGLGIQLSYLADYLSEENVYDVGRNGEINYDFRNLYYIDKPYLAVAYVWDNSIDPPEYYLHISREWESRDLDTYNTWLFGVLGELEIKKILFSRIIISVGIRYEYDISNSERFPGISYIGYYTSIAEERPKTHNIRKGLGFSVMYRF